MRSKVKVTVILNWNTISDQQTTER